MDPFYIIEPKNRRVPLILSVPHCGTEFPDELKDQFIPAKISAPDDTDWFVHQLYDFVGEYGITIIHAKYSRWVIDLNRDPESTPLYTDGRIITGLTPETDFFGEAIYRSAEFVPDEQERNRRKDAYFAPYHSKIKSLLDDRHREYGEVVLWDAHSIRRRVPTIRKEAFPDMILGDNDEQSASKLVIKTTLESLQSGPYHVNHNHPFKGGYITRSFGKPSLGYHAIQLEMSKELYMDDAEQKFDSVRAEAVRSVLRKTIENILSKLPA